MHNDVIITWIFIWIFNNISQSNGVYILGQSLFLNDKIIY